MVLLHIILLVLSMRLLLCRNLKRMSISGGVPGALVCGALGLASSLLGGLFGKSNTNKTNQMNYRIMQEQNRFNAEEAKKNRDWQEKMYRMFGTSSAKANDLRAAGLNALLGDVSAVS